MGKLVTSLLILTLYLGIGSDDSDGNVINIAAILFSESRLTAFLFC